MSLLDRKLVFTTFNIHKSRNLYQELFNSITSDKSSRNKHLIRNFKVRLYSQSWRADQGSEGRAELEGLS